MLPGKVRFSAPVVTSEHPFPLGPFPRHIWIHHNTPPDGLDQVCHEIWKRVQGLSEGLQTPALGPLLHHALCSDLAGTLQRGSTNSQSSNYLLDEPPGLQSIYRAMIGNREREMKLRALCDAQLSAKSLITGLRCSAKSQKNPKGLEDGSTTGTQSMESSKAEMPFVLQAPDTAKAAENQVMAEEAKVVEYKQKSPSSSASSSTAGSAAAVETQAGGQKQQLPPFAKIGFKTDSDAVTRALQNPVTTATSDKKSAKYNASTSGFSTTSMTTGLNQLVWQSLNFSQFSIFPNNSSFPQFQGPYHPRPAAPYQALHPSFGCFPRQVAPYSPQQVFQPPFNPALNYITLVQPGYPYRQRTPTQPSNLPDLPPVPGEGMLYPFSSPYGFSSSTPGGAVTTTLNYFSSKSYVKF
ncbi:uncharacterized protein C1orf94 homolog isoform X2 [Heliangelus exortis]|uniref:uncharacterized protein C1orf94 homolog isoform X2 n=1 Tax=Heliangelus exortis TaxID=472823 RepID=UPI003A938F4A